MKKNCNIVRDLIPLYVDNICSEESKKLVCEHLLECSDCREFLDSISLNIKTVKTNEVNVIKNFAKMINFKIIKRMLICLGVISLLVFVGLQFCGRYKFTMDYNDKVNFLILGEGKRWNFQFRAPYGGVTKAINVPLNHNGEIINNIFITRKFTIYDYVTSKNWLVGTAPDLPYQEIDRNDKMHVYYTTIDFDEIKKASERELEDIINKSTLIFTNEIVSQDINCTLNDQDYGYTLTFYDVNKQIISSEGDEGMPEELLTDIYSAEGHYQKLWFPGDKATDIFLNIQEYMKNKSGYCVLGDIKKEI